MISRLIRRIGLLALCGVALMALAAPPAPQYKVVKHIALGGDGGWDYIAVDSAARRVYVSRSTRMMVVDADSGKLLAEIPDTPGVHGIALAPGLNKGFISAGRANNVVVVDLKTLKATGTVAAGENPDAILYEPGTKRVFAFNGRSKNVTVIDAASLQGAGDHPGFGQTGIRGLRRPRAGFRQHRRQGNRGGDRCQGDEGHQRMVDGAVRAAYGPGDGSQEGTPVRRMLG